MRVRWEDGAKASARRYMRDQAGILPVFAAIDALASDPFPPPPDGVHHGEYHRLRVGPYRVVYFVDGDVVTIRRVDRVAG